MASSTSQHSSFFHLPLSSHSVDMNTASHPPPTSSSLPQTTLPEFHPHSSFPNVRQNRSPEWQPPVNADESFHSSLMTPFSSPAGARARLQDVGITPAAASLPSYGNPLPCTGDWEILQQKIAYTSSLPSLLPACNLPLPRSINISSRGTPDGSSAKEFGALAGNAMFSEGVLSTQSAMGFGASGIEKMSRLGSSWNSVNAASNLSLMLDASKGRLSIQGANPAASHGLANFTSEPGFAERAARFSSYCTQGYSELATSFPLTEGGKTLPRSSPHPYDGPPVNKLTRVSSCPPSRCGTPSSPSGNLAAGELQDANGVQENFLGQTCHELTGGTEHGKCIDKLRGRASYSPSVVETDDEETQKYGTSVDEPDELGVGVGNEESSSSEQGVRHTGEQALTSNSCKKRKNGLKENSSKEVLRVTPPISAGKEPKDAEEDEAIGKRHKNGDSDTDKEKLKSKVEQSNSGNSGESTPKSIKESSHPADQSKPDYIHVRARRGQATDSHSLAERVRREKISERMKFLQDLVPGCSKVTGKAVMLDEIINYVQSLQRQVEFLSMKLAAVNPRPDCNVESFFNKELMQPRAGSPSLLFAPESMNAYNQIHPPLQARVQAGMACGGDANGSVADSLLRRRTGASRQLAAMDAYGDSLSQQAWDDELQTVVQMGSGQGGGRLTDVAPQCPSGRLPCSQL